MTKFADIYELAADNYGLVTSAQARELGLTNNEVVQYARRGRLERLSHGLYRLARWAPAANDPYAVAVAQAGPGAYLCGESVLALLGLAPTTPGPIWVASAGRVRRRLPAGVRLVEDTVGGPVAEYEGIASQRAEDAIRLCRGHVMSERLVGAAEEAARQGYLTAGRRDQLIGELEGERRAC